MIPQRDLSLISNTLQQTGGQRIPEDVIERDYCLSWFLATLALHPLREILAFKGGTALRCCWFQDYRFSEDLDFTLIEARPFETIRSALDEIFTRMYEDSAIRMAFDRIGDDDHQNSHTFYLRYQGPLPAENSVKVDITITETLCFALAERAILRTYDRFADLPDDRTIRVYSLEEIIIEKLAALTDSARNEPRDLYDLSHLLEHADCTLTELRSELQAKLRFRKRPLSGLAAILAAKEQRLRRLWEARLRRQVIELPPFDRSFGTVRRALREADFDAA